MISPDLLSRVAKSSSLLLLSCLFAASGAIGCGDDDAQPSPPADIRDEADASTPDSADEPDASSPDAQDTRQEPDAADPLPPEPWAIDQPGPYQVGYTNREVTYQAQGADEPRALRLAIWYPTRDTEGETSVYYRRLLPRPDIFKDASVGPTDPAPLLLFSHGNAALAEQSYFMQEFFATHGWVVAAPDHTGNTVSDTQGAIDLTMAVFRPQDITAVLDQLLDLDHEDLLAGVVDPEKIALSGHSFGGFTTLALAGASIAVEDLHTYCEHNSDDMCDILNPENGWDDILRDGYFDPRIKAAIPQAPGGYQAFLDGLAEIETPTLLFTGGMDNTLKPHDEGDPIWAAMRGQQHIRVNLPTAGHFTFSNLCDIFGMAVEMVAEDGCAERFIPPPKAYQIINAYSLAFARQVLFNEQLNADLLDGTDLPFEEPVEVSTKHDSP